MQVILPGGKKIAGRGVEVLDYLCPVEVARQHERKLTMNLKSLLPVALVVSALVLLPGCGDNPRSLYEKYMEALFDGDEVTAAKCVIKEDVERAKRSAEGGKYLSKDERKRALKSFYEEMDKHEVEIEDDKAYWTLDGNRVRRKPFAVKEDGEWKLDI